jgi:tripartite-type tricarboxylate transporter receptor subunit TctC
MKETRMNAFLKIALILTAGFGMPGLAAAQEWPTKSITLIVPFAPGGSTDTTARLLADKLRNKLGQSVIVDNRAGAGGNIGASLVAKSAPDGYTLLVATNAHTASPRLYKNMTYDIEKDLVPVAQIVSFPNVLVVNKDFPAKTLAEFVNYVKEAKKPVNYGSAGNGSSQHLSGALFNNMVKGQMVHVPYKGGAPANVALLAGQIQVVIAPLVEVLPYIKAGSLRALGITTKTRSPLLPDVQAIEEVLPGYEVVLWNGILAPANTPPKVVATLNTAIRKLLQEPDMQKTMADQGYKTFDHSPAELKQVYVTELERWGRMVKISGASLD